MVLRPLQPGLAQRLIETVTVTPRRGPVTPRPAAVQGRPQAATEAQAASSSSNRGSLGPFK
jgi:hypothetical protein